MEESKISYRKMKNENASYGGGGIFKFWNNSY